MADIELRPYVDDVELRNLGGGKLTLSGAVIRYGARSRDAAVQKFGFRERIMAGAAAEVLQKADVMALDEHRADRYLGRTGNGTLRLIDSKTDLRYEVDIPDTAVGRDVAALAARGDYRGSSFGFRSADGTAKWSKDDDGTLLRTITAFKVFRDVGPTVNPAYETGAAEAALRNLAAEAGIEVEVRAVLEAAASGRLADLLEHGEVIDERTIVEQAAPAFHRRPSYYFV